MSRAATTELREFAVRTANGDVVSVSCDRVRVTPRGALLAIVGRNDADDERARCVLALPTGAWASVGDLGFADAPPHPLPPRRALA